MHRVGSLKIRINYRRRCTNRASDCIRSWPLTYDSRLSFDKHVIAWLQISLLSTRCIRVSRYIYIYIYIYNIYIYISSSHRSDSSIINWRTGGYRVTQMMDGRGRTDRRTYKRTGTRTDERTEWWTVERTDDGRTNGRAHGWTDGLTDGRMDGRTDGRMDERMDGQMDDHVANLALSDRWLHQGRFIFLPLGLISIKSVAERTGLLVRIYRATKQQITFYLACASCGR